MTSRWTVNPDSARDIEISVAWEFAREITTDAETKATVEASQCTVAFTPQGLPVQVGCFGSETLKSDEIGVVTSIVPHSVVCELKQSDTPPTAVVEFYVNDDDPRFSGSAPSFAHTGMWSRGLSLPAYDLAKMSVDEIALVTLPDGKAVWKGIAEHLECRLWPVGSTHSASGRPVDQAQLVASEGSRPDPRLLVVRQGSTLGIDVVVPKKTAKTNESPFTAPKPGFVYAMIAAVRMRIFTKTETTEDRKHDSDD